MKKVAVKFPWDTLITATAGSIIAVGISAFADEIIDWLKGQNLKSKSKDYYEQMIEAHPQLKKENPEVVARYWASLYHFAPMMAADPLASGAYIRQSIARGYPEEFGGPPIDTYSTLTGINKDMTSGRSRGALTEMGIGAGTKFLGEGMTIGFFPKAPLKQSEAPSKQSGRKKVAHIAAKIIVNKKKN